MVLPVLVNAGVLLLSLVLLSKFSHWTIINSERIAEITGFGKTAVGFILIAMSTSLPELTVAMFSTANAEAVGVAIGNVLGSNIVNVCFVLGTCILFASWRSLTCIDFLPIITREDIKSLQFGLFSASVIPLSLIYLGFASRFIGLLLIGLFAWNTMQLVKKREGMKDEGTLGEEKEKLTRYALMLLVGVAGVIVCSYYIVDSATFIALSLGVHKVVIGATIVAFGTSIPELATSLEATKGNSINLALANIVGSGFLNITLILGVTLIAANLTVDIGAFTNIAIFSLISNLFLWYFLSGERICWREGAVLIFLYALFLFSSLRL
ncbi:sodium:calcium antiporter [Candidatus Bathyarchaeota archaeon]|nr:sodium:calcium antiporter [Candidatus Bathyarchaeota archaeon]